MPQTDNWTELGTFSRRLSVLTEDVTPDEKVAVRPWSSSGAQFLGLLSGRHMGPATHCVSEETGGLSLVVLRRGRGPGVQPGA